MEQGNVEAAGEKLYLWAPRHEGADEYMEAVRPYLHLRGDSGAELDPGAWAAERTQASNQLWPEVLSETPSGRRPPY